MLGHVVGAEDPRAFAAFEPASIAHDSLRNLAQAKRAEGQAASRAEKAAAQQRAALAAGEQSFSQQKGGPLSAQPGGPVFPVRIHQQHWPCGSFGRAWPGSCSMQGARRTPSETD